MAEAKRPDGAVLHFLKELPAWVILFVVMMILISVNNLTPADFLPRLIDQAFGGLLTALFGIARARASAGDTTNNISTGTVETPAVNTESINDSTVNTESLNVENKEEK